MTFHELPIGGAFVIEPEPVEDERGFFARTWCAAEFQRRGLADALSQCSISYNRRAGTLRGMHLQVPPHAETKLVRCTAGAVYDVILDLRPGSPSYCRWCAVELSSTNRHAVYVPAGVAHGFQTLVADTELLYQISMPYAPESARGVRWDDPAFAIRWPAAERTISDRDRSYEDFRP